MSERVYIEEGMHSRLASSGLHTLAGALGVSRGQNLAKPGLEPWRERIRVELTDGPASREASSITSPVSVVYLKRFQRPPMRHQLQRCGRGKCFHSTAYLEWENARALSRAGIRAAQASACGERMWGPFEQASFVLLNEVDGESLERITNAMATRGEQAGRAQVDALARFVARFHRADFVHRDLYLCHIFLARGHSGLTPSDFVLIDLQRVFRPRWRRRRWMLKDLSALAFSTPDAVVSRQARLRFLARYCRETAQPAEVRAIARGILSRVARLERRSGRSRPAGPGPTNSPLRPATNVV